jgi:Capsule assembly protein Wzi
MTKLRSAWLLAFLLALQSHAYARGVTPYLPLNLDPEVEREVERVLVLGGKPVMKRPIPAALVLDALPKACEIDEELCNRVRRYLQIYMGDRGFEYLSGEAAATSGSNPVLPNQHGERAQSSYDIAAALYVQPSDYLLLNAGVVAYDGRTTATGSFLSFGNERAQVDVGYRDHWWSPMTDSAVLISTEAPTMPSVTISNYAPFTRLGISYEAFAARMSYTDKIQLTNGEMTAGHPNFVGLHIGLEPENSGWAFAGNRIMVYGGGAAGGQSIRDVLQAFFNPTKAQTTGFGTDQVIGKQEASITSRLMFPGPMPFSVYTEFAGNDTASGNHLLFTKTALSEGIQFPRIGPFDLTYELSEWQPTWYVHSASATQTGYGDGITNYLESIGHWFGDQRQFGDAVGGRSNMLRLGWEPRIGRVEATLRTLTNEPHNSVIAYHHEYMTSLSYSYPWRDYIVGAEVDYGRDVFGETYSRLAAYFRYGDALHAESGYADDNAEVSRPNGAEIHLDAGVVASNVTADITSDTPRLVSGNGYGPHVTLGARRAVSLHQDLGAAIEADDVHGKSLLSVRFIDYRYRFNGPLALDLFGGAARYDVQSTPAYGFYVGTGLQWRNIVPHWDVGLDYRYATKLDRLRLPSEPQGGYRPDAYYDISMLTLYASRKF